jgi:hypothetical protein
MEEIHEEGFEDVFPMMAKHQRAASLFAGNAVEVTAPESRTERAVGCSLGYLLRHHGIGVAVLDPMRHPD